ncbi:MAG: GNAT family N-acetyltransferase [bacterium]|nr:GNAT family N-acetyltransferase [bacterium]
MRSRHLPMTRAEFDLLPRKLGWKYEYWDKHAHISPEHHVVKTLIEVKPHHVNSSYKLRQVEPNDEAQLVSLYIAAFSDTIDFCDWEADKIAACAGSDIRGFFIGKRGRPLPVSLVVVDKQSGTAVIGAVLIVEREEGQPIIDMLFVGPDRQRKGVAAALVSTAINQLYRNGSESLKSHYHLGNEASRAWHQEFGFKEEVDFLLVQRLYYHAAHELRRREKIGSLTETERRKLTAEIKRWKVQLDELERIDH